MSCHSSLKYSSDAVPVQRLLLHAWLSYLVHACIEGQAGPLGQEDQEEMLSYFRDFRSGSLEVPAPT